MPNDDGPIAHPADDGVAQKPTRLRGLISNLKRLRDRLRANIAGPQASPNRLNPNHQSAARQFGEAGLSQDNMHPLIVRRRDTPYHHYARTVDPRHSEAAAVDIAPPPYTDRDPPAYAELYPPLPDDWRSKIERAKTDEAVKGILSKQDHVLAEAREKLGLKSAKTGERLKNRDGDLQSSTPKSSQPASPTSRARSNKGAEQQIKTVAIEPHLATPGGETATAVRFTKAPKVAVVQNMGPSSNRETSSPAASIELSTVGADAEPRASLAELHDNEQMPRRYDPRPLVRGR